MLNQIILVGRITQLPENSNLKIGVSRSYKNEEGIYETDIFNIKVSASLIPNIIDYTKVGDVIGVKGRLETINDTTIIVADRITFLSSSNTPTTPTTPTNNLEEGEI